MVQSENKAMYEGLVAMCEDRYPGFKVLYKDEVWYMRAIGKLAFFNPGFMDRYTTTMFGKVYFPSQDWADDVGYKHMYKVLAHEMVHLEDARIYGPLYQTGYIAPQIFALLAFFSVWLSFWWLLMLLFLAPLPAWFRMESEMRGYQMSMAVNFWRYDSVQQQQKDWIEEKFTGADYYWMWPFKRWVRKEIGSRLEKIESGAILDRDWIFKSVYDLMRKNGVLSA